MATEYQARPGSTGDLALRHIKANGPTLESDLAIAIDKPEDEIAALLAYPIKCGALSKTLTKGMVWLYDLGDGKPAPNTAATPPDTTPPRDGSKGLSGNGEGSALPPLPSITRPANTPPIETPSSPPPGDDHKARLAQIPREVLSTLTMGQLARAAKGESLKSILGTPDGMRVALWSDGALDVVRPGQEPVRFTRAETRQIVDYLNSISIESVVYDWGQGRDDVTQRRDEV